MRPSIAELQARIDRKRRWRLGGIPRAQVALEDARHAQLRAELEERRREQAQERREPGSFQREFELDE